VQQDDQPVAFFNLTDLDREVLSQTDEDFVPNDWENLKTIIGAHDLDLFKRYPSHLRRYLAWSSDVKARYGSIPGFVCQERLHWAPASSQIREKEKTREELEGLTPRNPAPFGDPADYKILRNDWPYAIPTDVAHLVIWLKTAFPVSQPKGDLLPEGREVIRAFVEERFGKPLRDKYGQELGSDRVLWFKNWSALQSVGALEHFHCLVRGAGEDLLWEWTCEGPRQMM